MTAPHAGPPGDAGRWPRVEGPALVCLLAAALLVWIPPAAAIFWVVGVLLLAAAQRWTLADKLFGLSIAALPLVQLAGVLLDTGLGMSCVATPVELSCRSRAMSNEAVVIGALLLFLFLACLGLAGYSLVRLIRRLF